MRKKLYDNKDVFEDLNIVDVENKEDLDIIKQYVEKGRNLLVKELDKYKELTTKSIIVDEFESMTKNACYECQQKLAFVKTCFERNGEDITDIQNTVDGALFAIGEALEIINNTVSSKKKDIGELLRKNRSVIKFMAETYNILKTTNTYHTCPICLTNEVNVFCDPCGHNYCDKCMKTTHYCYICRVKIQKLHSLFFP